MPFARPRQKNRIFRCSPARKRTPVGTRRRVSAKREQMLTFCQRAITIARRRSEPTTQHEKTPVGPDARPPSRRRYLRAPCGCPSVNSHYAGTGDVTGSRDRQTRVYLVVMTTAARLKRDNFISASSARQ